METIANKPTQRQAVDNNQVRVAELLSTFNEYVNTIKVLSLDCFDTLIWRKTAEPIDVFYQLHQDGISTQLRTKAESQARGNNKLLSGSNEVTLRDIYRTYTHDADTHTITNMIATEIAAETATCYALPGIIALIHAAKQHGLKIIIVSDTYFSEQQLRDLLKQTLPNTAYTAIDEVFCSSDYAVGKSAGLFNHVIKKLALDPHAILHVGDNHHADYIAAKLIGIKALKLLHAENNVLEALRLQTISTSFLDSSIRHTRPLINLFRGVIASDQSPSQHAANSLGYAALGPIMYAFSRYILNEIENIKAAGNAPKVIFLMRDAYLPARICSALSGQSVGTSIRISRFAAFAASFRTQENIDDYLLERAASLRFHDMCRQLLLPDDLTNQIISAVEKSNTPEREFVRLLHQEHVLATIKTASQAYRQRLKSYLEKAIDLQRGDTILCVDLGYSCTTQRIIAPLFKEEWGVDIIGRYLLSLRTMGKQVNRAGLIEASHYDDRALTMLVTHISILEQLCTANENSVVDYAANGDPIYSDVGLSSQQQDKLTTIQNECARFALEADQFLRATNMTLTHENLRDHAAQYLSRLIFFPTANELEFMQQFESDFNLGTKVKLPLFDVNKGLNSLRRRGWLHSTKDNLNNKRSNYAAEWRSIGLELSLVLMAQHRFDMKVALNDLTHRRDAVEILIINGAASSAMKLEAMPTYDGFYALMVPIINDQMHIGIRFGLKYRWLELDSAEMMKLSSLYSPSETEDALDASSALSLNAMECKSGGLYECKDDQAMLVFDPRNKVIGGGHLLRIVYRPIN